MRRLLPLFPLLLMLSCGDDDDPQSADAGVAAPDGGSDSDGGDDAPDGSLSSDGGVDPDAGETGLVTKALEPLEVWQPAVSWRVANPPPNIDVFARRFLERNVEVPPVGQDENGITWSERNPDEDGYYSPFQDWALYGALPLTVETPLRLVVRLESMTLLVDGRTVHSPDPYRTARVRLPIYLEPGEHLLFFRGVANGNRRPRILLERAGDAPVAPNLADVTMPEWVPGEDLAQPVGVHILNLSGASLDDLEARVLDHPWFEASVRTPASFPADAVTQVAFDVVPKGPIPDDGTTTATLTLGLETQGTVYTFELPMPVHQGNRAVRRTFVSAMDDSAQFYGETGPADGPSEPAALVLSLHGAGVNALGQARAYDSKDWAYIIAPTNRRPFGFDWQDWGRLDALEVLEQAQLRIPQLDPERIHVTGHSMGGHGTWHLGALYPDLFATVGPSAGWISFETYGGAPALPVTWDAARLHDDTLAYRDNFADRVVYMVHGTNDNNVPISQSRTMLRELDGIPAELGLHEEPGAGHWWDGDPSPGARCVDFPPLFERIRRERRTLTELDFDFVSPAPWVSPSRSFVEVQAVLDPYLPFTVQSRRDGTRVEVTSGNAAALEIDGSRLEAAGITEVEVDGTVRAVEAGPMQFGAAEKRPGRHGPLKEVFFRPFCFIHRADDVWGRRVAATLTSEWAMIGNGAACTLTFANRDEAGSRNRIYLGVDSEAIGLPASVQMAFSREQVEIAGQVIGRPTFIGVTFPEGDHLSASLFGTEDADWMVVFLSPYSSRSAFPDWFTFVLNDEGNPAYGPAGWFDENWAYDASFTR